MDRQRAVAKPKPPETSSIGEAVTVSRGYILSVLSTHLHFLCSGLQGLSTVDESFSSKALLISIDRGQKGVSYLYIFCRPLFPSETRGTSRRGGDISVRYELDYWEVGLNN
jgi:hypothetical protein